MICFKTNIDEYKLNCFPTNLQYVPRVGEFVEVNKVYKEYFKQRKLPTKLEVKSIMYSDNIVYCQLWYSKSDIQIMQQSNIDPF